LTYICRLSSGGIQTNY